MEDDVLTYGVELEPLPPVTTVPFNPADVRIHTEPRSVGPLLRKLKRDELDLQPDFQRAAGIWDVPRQSRLIESLLLKIPIPTFYMAEMPGGRLAVVDGVQRLTTIARFVYPEYIGADPLKLNGLQYLHHLNGRTFPELPEDDQDQILDSPLTVNFILDGTPEAVMFEIFTRINTGGQPLSPQELRHALIPGQSRELLKKLASSKPFLDATLRTVNPLRMADREMVLRFLAFRITDPNDYKSDDLDAFLRLSTRKVNDLDPAEIERLTVEFTRAMNAASAIFGEHAFRKVVRDQTRRLPINKAIFEATAVSLAKLDDDDLYDLIDLRFEVQERYLDLLGDIEFFQSVSVGIGDVARVHRRFNAMYAMLRNVADDAGATID
ncbi:GmrSD restriction endonuclease domain-containing protein [Actinocorallia lasiicapitis]